MHSTSFHSKVSFTFPSRLGVHCFALWQFATTALKGIKTIVTPACSSFGDVSLSARNWICRSITRLSVRSTPSSRSLLESEKHFARNYPSSSRKISIDLTRLRERCYCALAYHPAISRTCVRKRSGKRTSLALINDSFRGVWFSFALQFNPPESHEIFASLSLPPFHLSSSFLFDISNVSPLHHLAKWLNHPTSASSSLSRTF